MRALFAALALLFALVFSTRARAEELRPYDAPRLHGDGAKVPAAPPEYLPPQEEGGIKFTYHPAARERVRPLLARAAAIRSELGALLGRPVLASIEVRVAAIPGEMARLSPAEPPSYATAVAFSDAHLVVMSLSSPLSLDPPDLEDLLRHALAHLAIDEATDGKGVPRWLHEGFAVDFAGESSAQRAETLCRAMLRERPIPLDELDAHLPAEAPQVNLAIAEAADFARFATTGPNAQRFITVLDRLRTGDSFDNAVKAGFLADLGAVDQAFRKDMAKRYSFLPVLVGTTLLWAVVAAFVLLRGARRRKRITSARRHRGEMGELRARAAQRMSLRAERIARARAAEEEAIEPMPPDPEVPKVEHDGRWYTLH